MIKINQNNIPFFDDIPFNLHHYIRSENPQIAIVK